MFSFQGYLAKHGIVDLGRVQMILQGKQSFSCLLLNSGSKIVLRCGPNYKFLSSFLFIFVELGYVEDEIFKKRQENEVGIYR